MLKIQTMSNHNSEILIWHKMMQSYQSLSLKKFAKHVWTCPMRIDNSKISDTNWYNSSNILRFVLKFKTSDAKWYDSTNMSRLFLNTYDVIWYNRIISCQSWHSHVNMSRLVLNPKMIKYSQIWANWRKKVLRQSNSLDRFGKRAVKNGKMVTSPFSRSLPPSRNQVSSISQHLLHFKVMTSFMDGP